MRTSQRTTWWIANASTGRLTRNNSRQLPTVNSAAAMSGPRIRNDVPPVDISPISHPRRFAGAFAVPAASASGCITAAPMPCANLHPIRMSSVGAAAHAAEPIPKSTSPVSSTRFLPYRSATLPTSGMKTANASR